MNDITLGDYSLSEGVEYVADFLAGAAGGFVGGRIGGVYGAAAGRHLAQKYVKQGAFLIYYGTTTPYPTQALVTQSSMSEAQFNQTIVDEQNKNHDGSYIEYIISSLV